MLEQQTEQKMLEDTFWLRMPPPLRSGVLLGGLFGFAALLGIAGSQGTAESEQFVRSVPWTVWRGVASAALVVFVVLAIQAIRVLQDPQRWGMSVQKDRRNRYLVCAAAGAAAIVAYRLCFPGAGPDLPVQNLSLRTSTVLIAGMLASIPWLTVVWLAHSECHDLGKNVNLQPKTEYQRAMDDTPGETGHFRNAVDGLLKLWQLLLVCVGAFTVGVVAAVASSGALRGAFVAAHPDRKDEFPPANVLLYGGFFALALSIITVPLVASWRARAQDLVEHGCPLPADGKPTAEWTEERERLEKLLHLDLSILRNPLTALTVLTPLLISALAAFLPQIAG
jgi:H+/gluconate symporter-like permease